MPQVWGKTHHFSTITEDNQAMPLLWVEVRSTEKEGAGRKGGETVRNMSFRLTTGPFLDGSKDVTRRLGWTNLKAGEHFMGVKQAQGLKKGEKVQRLGERVCIRNDPEPLGDIIRFPYRTPLWGRKLDREPLFASWKSETAREGFPDLTPHQFVEMFCREMKCTRKTIVNRIEFARVI